MTLSREQMLLEMGISPIWVLRNPPALADAPELPAAPDVLPPAAAAVDVTPSFVSPPVPRPTPLPDMSAPTQQSAVGEQKIAAPLVSSGNSAVNTLNWPELTRQVAACRACPLCEQRKQAVLGVGDLQPDWLFIGEGPGAEEDVKGEPFVGQAGKLLDNMLAALDLERGTKVYIANAVKCRPPGNRTPEAGEMNACRPYLERQIALLKPKIIVLLGKAAVHSILHEDKTLSSLRGQRFEYAGIPVIVSYHPAYLLRNLPDKAKAWEDLLFARRLLRERTMPELPF